MWNESRDGDFSSLYRIVIRSFVGLGRGDSPPALGESPVIAIDAINPSGPKGGTFSRREKAGAGSWATASSENCRVNRFQYRFLDRSVVVVVATAVVLIDMYVHTTRSALCRASGDSRNKTTASVHTAQVRRLCDFSCMPLVPYRREISTAAGNERGENDGKIGIHRLARSENRLFLHNSGRLGKTIILSASQKHFYLIDSSARKILGNVSD